MDKKEVGAFLLSRRVQLGLSPASMGVRLNVDRTTIMRWEEGKNVFRSNRVLSVAEAYEIDSKEFATMCGYSTNIVARSKIGRTPNADVRVTVEDLEFLLSIARGLSNPMTLHTITELLDCRHQAPTS